MRKYMFKDKNALEERKKSEQFKEDQECQVVCVGADCNKK